jgi:hypothetical protein
MQIIVDDDDKIDNKYYSILKCLLSMIFISTLIMSY